MRRKGQYGDAPGFQRYEQSGLVNPIKRWQEFAGVLPPAIPHFLPASQCHGVESHAFAKARFGESVKRRS